MPIPPGITREDVLEALRMLDRGAIGDFGPPTRYEVLHAGRRYPPKAAIGFAATRVLGRALSSRDFSGGQGSNQANGRLRALGFEIVPRREATLPWDIAVGATVRRREDIHGGGGHPIRFGGAWYGGIEPSAQTPNVLIFSEPESGGLYGYNFDGWTPDGLLLYTGEGKYGDQRVAAGNKAILNHRQGAKALRVFRARPPDATYLGEFELDRDEPTLWADAPDADGVLRQVIVFRLRAVGDHIRGDLPAAPPIGATTVADIPAEPVAPIAADVPAEVNKAVAFTVEPSDEPVEYQRREAALVDRYKKFLDGIDHKYGRKRIQVPDQVGRLFTDLHDYALDELIEAKATSSRPSVRTGLGQLLDYARYVSHQRRALLTPTRPRPDLIELLGTHGCACIWEAAEGRFERSNPPD